jgi:hypothetical protein
VTQRIIFTKAQRPQNQASAFSKHRTIALDKQSGARLASWCRRFVSRFRPKKEGSKMLIVLLGLFFLVGAVPSVFAAPIDDVVAAAKQERVLELLAPSTTGDKGAQALGVAFNKKCGLNVKVNYTPSSNMTGDVAKLVMSAASQATPDWDVLLVTDAHHATLWSKNCISRSIMLSSASHRN